MQKNPEGLPTAGRDDIMVVRIILHAKNPEGLPAAGRDDIMVARIMDRDSVT